MYCLEKFWFVLSFVLCLRVVWLLSQRKRCCKRSCHVSSQFPTFLEELTAGARERAFTRHFLGPWPLVLMASQEAQARLAAGSFSCLLFALPFLSIFVYPIIYLGSSNSPPLCSNFFFSLGATLEPLLWRDSGNMLLLMLPSAKASSPYPPALAALPCALLHSGVVATAESADSKNDKGCYWEMAGIVLQNHTPQIQDFRCYRSKYISTPTWGFSTKAVLRFVLRFFCCFCWPGLYATTCSSFPLRYTWISASG